MLKKRLTNSVLGVPGRRSWSRAVCAGLLSVAVAPALAATAFQLNFNNQIPVNIAGCSATSDCTIPGGDNPVAGSNRAGNDGTRFIQEQLQIGNDLFFHVVVGDPASGFANESYTRSSVAAAGNVSTGILKGSGLNPFSPDQGGNEGATVSTGARTRSSLGNGTTLFGNGARPFNANTHLTGNGTADPSRTVLRMTLSDGQMSQSVSKPVLNRKPLINQLTTDNQGMTSEFVADMRGISYSEKDKAAPIVNRLHLVDSTLPSPGSADFDMSRIQRSDVTAGRFIFTPGLGWRLPDGTDASSIGWTDATAVFNPGTYTGPGAGFDPLTVDWASFFSSTQNNTACNFTGSTRKLHGVCP